MNQKDAFLDSISSVKQELERSHGLEAKRKDIRDVMVNGLGMSYRKITSISIYANSNRNLVCRQRFAMKLIELMSDGKRILNVDQTWLGMSDFRRMKWRAKGTTNSIPQLPMLPRISMFVGLDTEGQVYLSLFQANSNTKITELFFHHLAKQLDDERPAWRRDTVILIDNAPYQTSSHCLKLYQKLKLPILFTGPHSYDAAPIELYFAHFKADDINPRKVKTGKGHFEEVAELVIARMRRIPIASRLLFWRHCLLSAYKYLAFQRL